MSWRDKMKWGDESLKTPEHDGLMLWLDENCVQISQKLFPELDKNGFSVPQWEKPLTSKNGSILCFIDLFLYGRKQTRKDYSEEYELLFEVKPKIESIGELLRQLQSYSHYHNIQDGSMYSYCKKEIIVISPDLKAKDIILKNGFHFFNPEDSLNE